MFEKFRKKSTNTNSSNQANQSAQAEDAKSKAQNTAQELKKKMHGAFKKSMKASDFKKQLNSQVLKDSLSSRSNQALAISIIALTITLVHITGQESSVVNDFLEHESEYTERSFDDIVKNTKVKEVKAEAQQELPAPVIQVSQTAPQQGLTFADSEEFKLAVAQAITQIRRDEAKKVMDGRFEQFKSAQETVPYGKKIYGNPRARFLIQEFSDLECPYCKEFFNVPKEVADLSSEQVAVEWIHTPLSFHEPTATQEAIAAECVFEQKGNRAFWVALQQIFETTGGNGRGTKILGRFVDDFDLDRDTYINCINSNAMKQRIKESSEIAMKFGITGTPAAVILDRQTGQTRTLSGAQPAGALMQVIEEMNAAEAQVVETVTQDPNQAATNTNAGGVQ